MKFRCVSNAAIKNVKIARKKNQLFFQNIFNKIAILKKIGGGAFKPPPPDRIGLRQPNLKCFNVDFKLSI